ncbi:aliphatic sulfonates import ATP-binding protein SsuB 3 [Capsulimonas corticalis]|uniref:Aliphatic sulfonates import ATP-binding protein SsuB 3 n=1 Tax=Capsulimonas corticalis TaxID=2219043 RepID=A0A402CV18_9BACT|nr:ATP-binding cassette domain-containing protein [Capsulimonas corticalis]BDI30253.1 aliphatic sulfonates import ATP-binding protein SsuB 3 [Capsulimonas corticalis]
MASQLSEYGALLGEQSQATAAPVHVHVQDLHKDFGPRKVLRALDLEIRRGEFIAIVGKSGCGKSTLLRLLAGLDQPSGGGVRIDGRPLGGLNHAARVMFQDARLLPWERVVSNVGLGLGKDWRRKAESALADVGLSDRANDWPSVLSGGQRQRVALARALAGDPELLLLDEPLGALDALTRYEMQRLIEDLWRRRGCTVLLVTHDVEESVALADRVVVIDEGRATLDLRIDLPRPRRRSDQDFQVLRERILGLIAGGI